MLLYWFWLSYFAPAGLMKTFFCYEGAVALRWYLMPLQGCGCLNMQPLQSIKQRPESLQYERGGRCPSLWYLMPLQGCGYLNMQPLQSIKQRPERLQYESGGRCPSLRCDTVSMYDFPSFTHLLTPHGIIQAFL